MLHEFLANLITTQNIGIAICLFYGLLLPVIALRGLFKVLFSSKV